MKKKNVVLSAIVSVILALALLAGCTGTPAPTEEPITKDAVEVADELVAEGKYSEAYAAYLILVDLDEYADRKAEIEQKAEDAKTKMEEAASLEPKD